MAGPGFGAEVRRLRGERSQQEVATAAGITQAFLSEIETEKKTGIGADVLYRLCDALGVPSDHFRPFFPAATPPESEKSMGKRK